MNTSPFTTFKEFSEATGPIYTFANQPVAIAILLILVVAIFLALLIGTYVVKKPGA